jgi:hypothetical protein
MSDYVSAELYMVPLVYSALVKCGVKFCLMVLMYLNGLSGQAPCPDE